MVDAAAASPSTLNGDEERSIRRSPGRSTTEKRPHLTRDGNKSCVGTHVVLASVNGLTNSSTANSSAGRVLHVYLPTVYDDRPQTRAERPVRAGVLAAAQKSARRGGEARWNQRKPIARTCRSFP